ncbi:hypothetical protein [Mesorhizobium sp. M0578]|uniref:hypothetical protein n=1 Tax=unclassified Mesorhizobium TaxID=325217 RepID=UPI003335F397
MDTFLDQRFTPVSSIWAIDADEGTLLGKVPRSAVVHNPSATNPVPIGLLPAQDEYEARTLDDDNYQLERIEADWPLLTKWLRQSSVRTRLPVSST